MLSVGQLTDDPRIDVNFKGSKCGISHDEVVIETGRKCMDNLYKLTNGKRENQVLTVVNEKEEKQSDSKCDFEPNTSQTLGFDEEDDVIDGTSNGIKSWHNRLGHLSGNWLKHLTRLRMLPISKIQLRKPLNCLRCAQGKSHTKSHKRRPKKENSTSTRAVKLIYSDTCGPFSVPDINEELYFQNFIDDCTRMTATFLMRAKTQ